MKTYARQINPEYQESPLFDCFPDDIAVFGNRDYNEHLPDVVRRVREVLDAGKLAEALEDIEAGRADPVFQFTNLVDACLNFLYPEHKKTYNAHDVRVLKMAVAEYDKDEENALCIALTVVTGYKWESRQICGCCQSDWNTVYYPVDQWSSEALSSFEVEYFNTGSEWIIHDEEWRPETPDEITGYSVYCTSWNDEGIRKELANAAGCTPEELIMYSYGGSRSVDIYEEARSK